MHLTRVTVAGVDDSVEPGQLAALSLAHPFVEWAVLFSQDRQGSPRYPSLDWVDALCREDVRLAAHLCGRLAVGPLTGGPLDWKNYVNFGCFDRIQLNHRLDPGSINFAAALSFINDCAAKEFIVQVGTRNAAVYEGLRSAPNVAPLFDRSGGRGVLPEAWPEPCAAWCGYAGGLNPDNLDAQLKILTALPGGAYWVDMESGVRTDDRIDLDKVRACLDVAGRLVVRL